MVGRFGREIGPSQHTAHMKFFYSQKLISPLLNNSTVMVSVSVPRTVGHRESDFRLGHRESNIQIIVTHCNKITIK
jgi:hypothetical protein